MLLISIPGLLLLARTRENFVEVQTVQREYDAGVRALEAVTTRIVNGSLLVREFLLDSSPINAPNYRKRFEQNRTELRALLLSMRDQLRTEDQATLDRLDTDLQAYATEVLPIFDWTPDERREKSTWFLRQQQRLRRDTLLATAGLLAELHKGNYSRQQLNLERSQLSLTRDLQRLVLFATLLGIAVAGATVFRIYGLERRSSRQQSETEHARAELQTLSHELLRAQESERRSLSRELHDQVGQTLTALRMELGALERLRQTDQTRFTQHLSEAKMLAEGTLRTVRDIAAGLRPSLLDDLGLGPALELETRDFTRRTGTSVNMEISGEVNDLPENHRICLFRIVQEALTNCARHANASSLRIRLANSGKRLLLEIEDDGAGCEPRQLHRGAIGVLGMQERVRELNGAIHFQTAPGRGLHIAIEIPLVPALIAADATL